jgi:uncharacterized protein YyaL (SSP411 family)
MMSKDTPKSDPVSPGRRPNRLIHEKSPYLRQHADNPVDWYPWGPEAFEKARREDKPIFLSIGYSSCHWCHVMERESFEDPEIADLLNRFFVPVKVDREERPDVDQIYMQAVMAMTGTGGWPLNVFLTPDLKPFFGGTYFPPDDRWGRPSFRQVLQAVARAWRERRPEVERSAEGLTQALQAAVRRGLPSEPPPEDAADRLVRLLEGAFDPKRGGFGSAPKFPPHAQLRFLLRYAFRTGSSVAQTMVETTLTAMAHGGIYDQVGGGFHRYSVDADWLVPHFEKMLYDNAQLAVVYAEAYAATGHPLYGRIAVETLDYLLRDMQSPEGAFYSAEDADSDGREGAFYVWTRDEILAVLGPEWGERFAEQYGVSPEGNVLHVARPFHEVADRYGIPLDRWLDEMDRARRVLRDARTRRPRPLRDEKILTDWNGLALSAFALGGFYLRRPDYVEAAKRLADWLWATMWDEASGTLFHRFMEGERAIPGFLADYTYLAQGLLDLYEVAGRPEDLDRAVRLMDTALARFWDASGGGFFDADPQSPDLITPLKESFDGAVPAGNSVALWNLERLFEITGIDRYREHAEMTVRTFAYALREYPAGLAYMGMAWDFALQKPVQIVFVGTPAELADARAALQGWWFPYRVLVWRPEDVARPYPAWTDKVRRQDRQTIYVCRDFTCQPPVHDLDELRRLLETL